MRFLADMGISMATGDRLRAAGEEVIHLREEGFHKLPDDQILAKGYSGAKSHFDLRP